MSELLDTDQYGKASVESGQNYQALPDPREMQERADEQASAERIAQQMDTSVAEPGTGVNTPFPIEYQNPETKEVLDKKWSVEPERAAKDLADYRRGMEDIQRAIRDTELSSEIDKLRGAEAAQPQPEPQQQQPAQEPVPEPLPPLPPELQGEGANELAEELRRSPRVLEAVQTMSWQKDQQVAAVQAQALQYAEAAQQQAEQFVQANARQAIAGIFVRHPELQNLSQQELPLALNLLQRSNPERHAAIMHEIAGIQGLLNESNRVAQVQQQRATQQFHQQFHTWSGEEDSKFVKAHPEMADSATASSVTQRTRAYVHNKGFSDDDIARAWSGQAHLSLRDARVQSMLYDAMRYREALAAVPAARANKPVRVQTPGPSGQIASQDDADLRSLSQRLTNAPTGTASVRAAAELLAARRAKSR